MPASYYTYSSFYHPSPQHYVSLPYPDTIPLSPQDFDMSPQDISFSSSMQPPPSPSLQIDPSLSLYPPYYSGYQQSQSHLPPHLSISPNYSSPSSQGSETIGTPPMEHMYASSSANSNGKRPASTVSTVNGSDSRKKARKDDDLDDRSHTAEKEEKVKPTRGSRACTVCRRLKMRCVGAEHGPPCKRCQSGNHECIFEESNRGKRSSKKHELLTRSLRKMERTLDTVLRSIGNPTTVSGMISRSPSPNSQSGTTALLDALLPSTSGQLHSSESHRQNGSPKLHSLPDNALNPLGLLAEASLANRRIQGGNVSSLAVNSNNNLGVASDNYFKPGPMTILPLRRLYIERQVQPEMLTFVNTDEVVALFNIFFDHMNMHCNLLDRNFHTPSLICSRSPFLLTTICAIASKFYTENAGLHSKLTELANKLAFSVPAQGYKSVEIVQAYLLLALWGCGAVERYEQDKTWMLLGMAIRMATDLNLHRKTSVKSQDTEEGRARDIEIHNRERTWLLCFCLDRSFSSQMGKPHSIEEDQIIRNADIWCVGPLASEPDTGLAGYVELQSVLARALDFLYSGTDSPSGLQTTCDYMVIIKTFEAQILTSTRRWQNLMETHRSADPIFSEYRKLISQFYVNYCMLIVNSFGLQNALERSPMNIGHFFARCHSSAMTCATLVRDKLGPMGYMRYSPDSHCVQTSYAVLTLLKLVRPELAAYLEDEANTVRLVKDVADVLDDVSVNPTHTPALYSGFLKALISAKLEPPTDAHALDASSADSSQPQPSQQTTQPQQPSSFNYNDPSFMMHEFQFDSEMGPAMDINTFPPTMAPPPQHAEESTSGLTMDSILSSNFWDSVLVPGYNSMDGLSGGFVFGAGGSGLITPRLGFSPFHSGQNTPSKNLFSQGSSDITQLSINAAFDQGTEAESIPV